VESDNEDFFWASGSLFAICTCPPISKCVYFSLPLLDITLFSNDLFDESRPDHEKLVFFWQHLIYNILVGLNFPKINFSHIAPHKAFHCIYWEGKGVEWIGIERQYEMRVHEQDARKFIFELGLALYLHHALISKFLRFIWNLGEWGNYLWEVL
jgi:hypothetical protein